MHGPHASITEPGSCLEPARDRCSFNYVFHVCVPRLHVQQLLSRSNLSHTASSLTLSRLPIKTGLCRVCQSQCVHVCFRCAYAFSLYFRWILQHLTHVPCGLLSLHVSHGLWKSSISHAEMKWSVSNECCLSTRRSSHVVISVEPLRVCFVNDNKSLGHYL